MRSTSYAYGEDCILSGRTVLDGDRLTDMLNENDEYALLGVMVERLDGGPPIEVAEVVVPRDELWLVHASRPRGNPERRHRTSQQHLAIKMGPYTVRGFYHALPGADPVAAIRRRKAMVPLTDARIEYAVAGEQREVRVDTVVVNRDLIEWVEVVEPDRIDFPVRARAGRTEPALAPTSPSDRGYHRATMAARPRSRSRAARRPARHRLLDGPGRAVLHDAPRRPRRRRHQGRAARGRRDARLGPAVGRPGGRRRDAGRPPTTSRSTATSAAIRLDLKTPDGAAILRRLLVDGRRPRRELPGRRLRPARVRRRGARRR